MHDGALNHALESERGLRIDLAIAWKHRRVLGNELAQVLAQYIDIGRAGKQNIDCGRVVQQRQQQMFDGDEVMSSGTGIEKGHMQTEFKREEERRVGHMGGRPWK